MSDCAAPTDVAPLLHAAQRSWLSMLAAVAKKVEKNFFRI
jgi:hypothetical protein